MRDTVSLDQGALFLVGGLPCVIPLPLARVPRVISCSFAGGVPRVIPFFLGGGAPCDSMLLGGGVLCDSVVLFGGAVFLGSPRCDSLSAGVPHVIPCSLPR